MTANEALDAHFNEMPKEDAFYYGIKLRKHLGITAQYLWMMRKGIRRVSLLQGRKINEFFGEGIFANVTE